MSLQNSLLLHAMRRVLQQFVIRFQSPDEKRSQATQRWRLSLAVLATLGISVLLSSCAIQTHPVQKTELISPPIRFLLTFDDGPSSSVYHNPTESILDDLAHNPVQPGIKALFFVQTRGGSTMSPGRELLRREHAEGHLLGFHTATARHANHRYLSPVDLETSLQNGIADITAITGSAPTLVRPPFWSYDRDTFARYQAHGLHLLLTDLHANDGKIYGFNGSPRRRINLHNQLAQVRTRIEAGKLPVIDGVIPVVITFHDINSYTARHLQEYLQMLIDVATELGMPTAAQAFYSDRSTLETAALARTLRDSAQPAQLPGIWGWVWQ